MIDRPAPPSLASQARQRIAEDADEQDRRVELAAARNTALRFAERAGTLLMASDPFADISRIERFLLEHPAGGEVAFDTALRTLGGAPLEKTLDLAGRYARYLATGTPHPAPDAPVHHAV